MKSKLFRIAVVLASVVALMLGVVSPAIAADYDEITVTATPAFMSISITNDTWTINGLDGTGKIAINTTYYSNETGASGDVTAPNATVLSTDCYFVVTNLSTIETDLTANMIDFTGGDAMTNINTGYANNGANAYGASTYTTGAAWPGEAVILKSSGSSAAVSDLTALTDVEFGVAIKTQSGAWSSGSNQTSTITVTATDST